MMLNLVSDRRHFLLRLSPLHACVLQLRIICETLWHSGNAFPILYRHFAVFREVDFLHLVTEMLFVTNYCARSSST